MEARIGGAKKNKKQEKVTDVVDINPTISIIINVNGLNAQIKRLSEWIKDLTILAQ